MAENDQLPKRPRSMGANAHAALDAAISVLHLGEDLTDELLTPTARSDLEARRQSLAMDNRWGTRGEIAQELMAIRLVMGASDRLTAEQAARKLEQQIFDLSDVPIWALAETARAYRRGDIGDGKWGPRSGQLRKEAMKLAAPFLEEAAKINRVLLAPVVEARSPAERKVTLQKLRALIADVTTKSA